ncbi:hypothetical protein A0H81_14597 [Grifola frondosa]|uniref:Glutathione S-transferase UstS-like C-terminal domain-containing protein n=1 Tax=Grifola frondosa TaxID=5627 RepID=A0A1C7LL42_GRIFR|nr:hypothetical protein A0H81_14597 [Grifola frondosa]
MSAKHHITLFDVKCILDPPAWSPNTWRTRFVLNYKRLSYHTEWIAYPDIGNVLSSAGVPPTRSTAPLYTVPAIIDEMAYIGAIGMDVIINMAFMVMPNTVNILEGRELEYYVVGKKEMFGIGVEDMFPADKQDAMWTNLKEGLNRLSKLIESVKHGNGFLFGTTPTYADFVLCSQFIWFEKAGPKGGWEKIKEWNNGKWAGLYESLKYGKSHSFREEPMVRAYSLQLIFMKQQQYTRKAEDTKTDTSRAA